MTLHEIWVSLKINRAEAQSIIKSDSSSPLSSYSILSKRYLIEAKYVADAERKAKELFLNEILAEKLETSHSEVSVTEVDEDE